MDNLIEFLNLMDKYGLSSLEYQNSDSSVRLKKSNENNLVRTVDSNVQDRTMIKNLGKNDSLNLVKILSPLVGIFHLSEKFKEEKNVTKGEVIGRIESMKMFTDVTSPCSGIINKIEVDDDSTVEFEQELIKIDKG